MTGMLLWAKLRHNNLEHVQDWRGGGGILVRMVSPPISWKTLMDLFYGFDGKKSFFQKFQAFLDKKKSLFRKKIFACGAVFTKICSFFTSNNFLGDEIQKTCFFKHFSIFRGQKLYSTQFLSRSVSPAWARMPHSLQAWIGPYIFTNYTKLLTDFIL